MHHCHGKRGVKENERIILPILVVAVVVIVLIAVCRWLKLATGTLNVCMQLWNFTTYTQTHTQSMEEVHEGVQLCFQDYHLSGFFLES